MAAYRALYRKYRPQTFSDVVGQEHITTTLRHQVESGTFSHAYLFTGSRGTGKTTCAKILARAINCLNPHNGDPCGVCENCKGILNDAMPDVLEIDAASNNGVDYIRELRERIAFAPAEAKYRVYIIDEVHMLSASASNALLKTLEEPPEHAVFILATTEVNALLPTILSRCQRYDFHRIEPEIIAKRLSYVAKSENAQLTDDAAMTIAGIADGGMRDALSLLDLLIAASDRIDEETVNRICGRASNEYIFTLAEEILNHNTAAALETVANLHAESVDMQRLCGELCEFWRTVTLICSGISPQKAVAATAARAEKYQNFSQKCGVETAVHCLQMFNEAYSSQSSGNRRSALEMAVIKLTNRNIDTSESAVLARIAAIEQRLASGEFTKREPESANETQKGFAESNDTAKPLNGESLNVDPSVSTAQNAELQDDNRPLSDELLKKAEKATRSAQNAVPQGEEKPLPEWNDIVATVYKTAPLMYGLVNGSTATIRGDFIIIHSASRQLRSQMTKRDGMNYKGLLAAITSVMGRELTPVMEPEEAVRKDDPLQGLVNRLEKL